ncbi:MAG: hypothetical protein U9Q80_11255 [Bacillota bacterium]|nr:hypothetical protein [Bacillota bacterium]
MRLESIRREGDGKVVGSAGLNVHQNPCTNHVASFGIGFATRISR